MHEIRMLAGASCSACTAGRTIDAMTPCPHPVSVAGARSFISSRVPHDESKPVQACVCSETACCLSARARVCSGAPDFMPERMRGASGGPACTHHRWIRAPPPERADDLDAFFKEIDEESEYDWVDLPSGSYVL